MLPCQVKETRRFAVWCEKQAVQESRSAPPSALLSARLQTNESEKRNIVAAPAFIGLEMLRSFRLLRGLLSLFPPPRRSLAPSAPRAPLRCVVRLLWYSASENKARGRFAPHTPRASGAGCCVVSFSESGSERKQPKNYPS